jgi:Ca2+-binding RTX toxin-like protein
MAIKYSVVLNRNVLANGVIAGDSGNNTLNGTSGNDQISGLGGNDILYGNDGNDTLAGGTGSDYLSGGAGADTYLFAKGDGQDEIYNYDGDGGLDVVKFTGLASTDLSAVYDSGTNLVLQFKNGDRVTIDSYFSGSASYLVDQFRFSNATWTMADLALRHNGTAGADSLNGFAGVPNLVNGLAGNDRLYGNDGNDTLAGGTGSDYLSGGAGADTYLFAKGDGQDEIYNYDGDGGVDVVKFTNVALTDLTAISDSGTNLVLQYGTADRITVDSYFSGSASYRVDQFQFVGGDTLTNLVIGTAGKDSLVGTAGNDALSGLAGADVMSGGKGNDLYLVDNVGDIVKESLTEGIDTVNSSVTYTLPANLENLVLSGSLAIKGVGNGLANTLTGNKAANTLDGGNGSDILNGAAGADVLKGGAGNDIYVVDNVGDTVVENPADGIDTVQSSVGRTLEANVEDLTLTGVAAINGTGNELANSVLGNPGANVLDGGAGADTLQGGAGADTFVFGTATGGADKVLDFLSGLDKLRFFDGSAGLNIGDGDHLIDDAVSVAGPGGFSSAAELVVVTQNIAGSMNAASAALDIGAATSAYGVGAIRLFAVDNGIDSALFLFKSADADALVGAPELTLIGTLQGTPQTSPLDYGFA